jgi:hypothetical protein
MKVTASLYITVALCRQVTNFSNGHHIKIALKYVKCGLYNLVQDRVQWLALVNTVMHEDSGKERWEIC